MIFHPQSLAGAVVIDLERIEDERGFFARTWSPDEFAAQGLNPALSQCSLAQNRIAGTLRGMHFQAAPHEEAKLVRCTAGAIFDVIIDLRDGSPSRTRWIGVELSAWNRRMLYVPEGFAHGYQALTDDSEVLYLVTAFYAPEHEAAIRWNDPLFGIRWPLEDVVLSPKDAAHPDFRP